MDELTLEIVEQGIDELIKTIHDGFDAVPLPSGVEPYQPQPVAFALRNRHGEIEGGVVGQSVWGWLYVNYIWVSEPHAKAGHGRRLLEVAEREAEARGCRGVWLHTISFQAPGFYERLGYERFGELPDFPDGHCRIFYRKFLTPTRD